MIHLYCASVFLKTRSTDFVAALSGGSLPLRVQIVQGKKEAARQAAGLAPGGRSPRGAPLRPQRELRPPTHKRSPATSRPRRRGARGPLIPPPGVASFDAVRARAREVSMTSEELLRSSREIRAEMRASVARNEARGAYSAPVDGFAEVEEQQFQTDSQTEQQQRGSQEEEERHVLGAAGTTGLYDSRAGFSPPRPPSVPPLTGEGPFRLASLYPAHLYSELARGSPPGPVFQPIPRPTPHYLAPPWTGALQASLFPWAAPFAGTPGFGLEAGPSALMGAGLPLGGFNLEVPPPDVPQAGSPELDERETPTMGEIQGGRWQQPINAEGMSGQEGGASAKFSGREWAAGDSKDVAGNGQQLGCGDTFPMLGRGLDEARHRESGSPEAEANAGQGDAATGGLQAMPRVAGMDAVEHSLALLSGRGGGETAEREDGQGGAQGGTGERQSSWGALMNEDVLLRLTPRRAWSTGLTGGYVGHSRLAVASLAVLPPTGSGEIDLLLKSEGSMPTHPTPRPEFPVGSLENSSTALLNDQALPWPFTSGL